MKLTVVLAVLVGILALACSTVTPVPAEPTPNIDEAVEAKVAQERAVDATVEAKVSGTLSASEAKTQSTTQAACKLTGGETVQSGWTGKDTGDNSCNSCFCTDGALGCTKMACPAHEVSPDAQPPPEIVFASAELPSLGVQNAVAQYILEYGYQYATSTKGTSAGSVFRDLRDGDIDVHMEIWLSWLDDKTTPIWEEEVINAGNSLDDRWYSSFLIPGYLQDANPGFDSVEDLKDSRYKRLFSNSLLYRGAKVTLWGCPGNAGCYTQQKGDSDTRVGQIAGMGLQDHVEVRSSSYGSVGFGSLEEAYKNRKPILFYHYGPNDLSRKLDMRDLEQPPSSECPDNDPAYGCAIPNIEIKIGLSTRLIL